MSDLSCFSGVSPSGTVNGCSGAYATKFHGVASAAACAAKCVADASCVQFVFESAGATQDEPCRLSATCTKPHSTLVGWDGYLRNSTEGACATAPALGFGNASHPGLWAPGMILQRDRPTSLWGTAPAGSRVTVSVASASGAALSVVSATTDPLGQWYAALGTPVAASSGTVLSASADGHGAGASIADVSWGDVLLCGGQSNMGFGMCGATSAAMSPTQALAALPTGDDNPIRFFWQSGDSNGGAGSTAGPQNVCTDAVTKATPQLQWIAANATNAGAASAVCVLTAQRLRAALGGSVPVGVVESCVGGTNVEPWTPPHGALYEAHIVPLLPMTFAAALWDQGEADAKRTNSTWYASEFPAMVEGWRRALRTPALPFVYVELCTEYGAAEPKEGDFWSAQRAVLALPATGFATTTDIQRALHPPDKMTVADRLVLELSRLLHVPPAAPHSRGPELLSKAFADGQLTLRFSNDLAVLPGQLLPCPACVVPTDSAANRSRCIAPPGTPCDGGCPAPVMQVMPGARPGHGVRVAMPFEVHGNTVVINCTAGNASTPVLINADTSECFLYGPSQLPAPPLSLSCSAAQEQLTAP